MFQNGPFLIIFGAFLIGLGGILGILGWNRVSTNSQKKNIVASVIRECESNKKMIDEAIALIENPKSSALSFSYSPYKATHLGILLTSGLFDFAGNETPTIRVELEKYEKAIESFNAALRIVGRHNPGLFLKPEFIHDLKSLKNTGVNSVLTDKFKILRTTNQTVLSLLSDRSVVDKL